MKHTKTFLSELKDLIQSEDLALFNCDLFWFHYGSTGTEWNDIYPDVQNATYALCTRKFVDAISLLLVSNKGFFKPTDLNEVKYIYKDLDRTTAINKLDDLFRFLDEDKLEIVKIR